MKNTNIKFRLRSFIYVMMLTLILGSCENYLDKAPEASITEKEAFTTFIGFQGFVEELYNCIANPHQTWGGNDYLSFNPTDEILQNVPIPWDDGNYRYEGVFSFLNGNGTANTGLDVMQKRLFPLANYAIRKANLGLKNLELFTGTQEEKDILEGQLLFFRGFFHFEMMKFYGGIPYVDQVLSPTGPFDLPRLNYRETALKVAADFTAAAELLPLTWDETTVGKVTLGSNRQRIAKLHAISYLGKDLLYAASPLMNEESTGSNSYDAELCKLAAEAFKEVIRICNETLVYQMQPYATYSDVFWVWSPGLNLRPGGKEVIMNPTIYNINYSRFTTCRTTSPVEFGAGNTKVEVPTHNFTKYYGMANGLPISDPASGYDPADPWTGRDPRFYKDIIYDGVQMVTVTTAGLDQFAKLYNGGRHKGGVKGSVTGYYCKKFTPLGCNQWDNKWGAFQCYQPMVRLADIYLMYAEAVLHGYGTPQSSVPGGITAEAAINVVRNRVTLPNLDSKFTGTKEAFMGELIRERAVELAFEGHRFFDLRRWKLATNLKYREKTAIDFDRAANGKPINLKERLVVTKVFDQRNYWFPFRVSFTKLYAEFPQNPGW